MRKILRQPLVISLLLILVVGCVFFARRMTSSGTSDTVSRAQKSIVAVPSSAQKQGGGNIAQAAVVSYTKKSNTPALASEIIAAHTLIYTSAVGSVAAGSRAPDTIPGYLAASQSVLSTDVVAYLEQASDKEAAVDTLLWQLEYYRGAGEWHLQQLQSTIQQKTAEYNSCTKDKTTADSMFYAALREGDAVQVEQSMGDAETAAGCQAKARVVVNAHKAMLERTQASYTAMGNLSIILQNDRSLIVDHFDLFRSNTLEKLVAVRNTLRTQKFTTTE